MMEKVSLTQFDTAIKDLKEKFLLVGVDKETFLKEASFAMQAITKNDLLASCSKVSIQASVYNLALTGLTLNPALEYAYLVPRGKKCILDISYRGMVKIATDSGGIKTVHGKGIYEKDFFEAQEGSDPYIKHAPLYFEDRGEMIGAYVVATIADGTKKHHIMSKAEIKKVEKKSPMAGKGPWKDWTEEMWIKTVIKRARKLWPHSDKLAYAVQVMNEAEGFPEFKHNNKQKAIATSNITLPSEPILAESAGEWQHEQEPIKNGDKTIVEPGTQTPPETEPTASPWDFSGDSEAKVSKEHRSLILKTADSFGFYLESNVLPTIELKTIDEIKNKHLKKLKYYFENI